MSHLKILPCAADLEKVGVDANSDSMTLLHNEEEEDARLSSRMLVSATAAPLRQEIYKIEKKEDELRSYLEKREEEMRMHLEEEKRMHLEEEKRVELGLFTLVLVATGLVLFQRLRA